MKRPLMSKLGEQRGAILIQVAVAMIGLLAFLAFVIDYGVLWASRRQAQNVADSAALSGAISMGLADPGNFDQARISAKHVGETNHVFGIAPTINQGAGDSCDETNDVSFPFHNDSCGHTFPLVDGARQCPTSGSCVRVNVYRNESRDPLPTFFGRLFGRIEQGVKATATAETSGGNEITCLLPFAVMDRWSDSYDDNVQDYPWDGILNPGTDGWSENDDFQPTAPGNDTYIGPYNGNTNFTGWNLDRDYGKQFILKDGNGAGGHNQFSAGWFSEVRLPGSIGSAEYRADITGCNEQPVGIAKEDKVCDDQDEANGCIRVKTGVSTGPTVKQGIEIVYDRDSDAHWDASAQGPDGHMGAVVGGQGMGSPRIRPLVVMDINDYMAASCSGGTCIGKVANILGFFVEGVCNDSGYAPVMDPGMICKNNDVVGRIVEIPGSDAKGAGTVETPASFVRVIRLIR